MITREQSVKRFCEKAEEAAASSYLFATKKIAEMLDVIATSRILFEIFDFCCAGEDADQLRKDFFISDGTHDFFCAPKKSKQFVALGFYVLKDIADGITDFNAFLTKYFAGDEGLLHGYEVFTANFIIPFSNTVKNVAENVMSAQDIQNGKITVFPQEKPDIDLQYLQGLHAFIQDEIRKIELSSGGEYYELLIVDKAILSAAEKLDVDALPPLAVAYKYAPRNKKLETNYKEVIELLTDHGILKR